MALEEYRRKRNFKKTSEPAGGRVRKAQSAEGRVFVIQKHAARRLHYDFRLELEGVLKSWAVARGPSYDPKDKRLAVHTEDHPVEYGEFEGIIPKGEYGGGTVLLWDQGRWFPEGDPAQAYADGRLKFRLEGRKMHGRWALIRMGGKSGAGGKNWLLIKERDEFANSAFSVVDELPQSVATGRDLDQIAEEKDRIWRSNPGRYDPSGLPGARKGALPDWLEPQLATLVENAPKGERWLHEIKFDGYRALARVETGRVRLLTRRGNDWTNKFRSVAEALKELPVNQALIDGEIVILKENGASSFETLQQALSAGDDSRMLYYVFDLLHLDQCDLTQVPLGDRKELLRELLPQGQEGRIRFSDHVEGRGPDFLRQACRLGLEGVVSKRRDLPYRAGRVGSWMKAKCLNQQELVIGGFTKGKGARQSLGALHLGYYERPGSDKLRYAGKVGTGLSDQMLTDLNKRLKTLTRKTPPFADSPRERNATWVEPRLVAEIGFTEWTREGLLRHPSFKGLRLDRDARGVVREVPQNQAKDESASAPPERPLRKKMGTAKKSARAATSRAKRKAKTPSLREKGDGADLSRFRLTNPDRLLWPKEGVTKSALAEYYLAVADWILPHLAKRALTLVRCPNGYGRPCFYQRHPGEGLPSAIRENSAAEKDDSFDSISIDDVDGLVGLAQIGALEIHIWGSRLDRIELADRLVFDLDPDDGLPWGRVAEAAKIIRMRLRELGLESFLKTTGGKGLHVVAPIRRGPDWGEVKAFTKAFAEQVAVEYPTRFTANMSKAKRKGRIYVDFLRNQRGATFIAPYSTRAKPGAPASVPIFWEELEEGVRSNQYNIATLPGRLRSLREDPWAEIDRLRQSITATARRKLDLDALQ
ncbi:MAG TPA: DNA ligase D [Alphaproteobacteria bacterium]|nr:DNA ligase D [Alphaproteobacteria bacterium]